MQSAPLWGTESKLGARLARGFELAFFQFFLAGDAVARPRDGFEALGIDLVAAGDALAVGAFIHANERGGGCDRWRSG